MSNHVTFKKYIISKNVPVEERKKTQNAKNFSSLTLIFEFSIKFTTIWYIVYLVTKLVSIFQKEESSAWINKCHLVPPCEVSECVSLPAVLHRDT